MTENHLEFISLKGDCTGSLESIYVRMPHCLKSHIAAHIKCDLAILLSLNLDLLTFLCMLTTKALVILQGCAGSSEHCFLANSCVYPLSFVRGEVNV